MRPPALIQALFLLLVIAALIYVVIEVSTGWADWIVFGAIVAAALGGALAVWNRQYPSPTKKRRFTRDSSSRW